MKENVKNLLVFVCICTVITLLLAVTNVITAPIIEEKQREEANKALLAVMPEGTDFDEIDLSAYTLPKAVTEAYKEKSGKGYVIKLKTAGYRPNMVIMCGVSADGVVTGAVCITSSETLGKEKTYGDAFKDKDISGVKAVDTISGATKTTAAYKNAVIDAVNSVKILEGGSADIRTEEEILADELKAALPSGNGEFEKMFLVEHLENVDSVYSAKNSSGYVLVYGEKYVGVLSDGTVVTGDGELSSAAREAVALISATKIEDIDLSSLEELEKTVVSAKKTATGNYILETKGAGYGIKGGNEHYSPSGEYIIVRVSLTPDGRIIDCKTEYEAETDGVGDACADPIFYSQFVGKTEENYTDIDAISGATMTTEGYLQAIERAFNALKILKGVE